ncbi:MAG: hypothetical protein J2P31_21155, partial [Blastocatellia bacterium]|nr:hypothetical protein [Blastocatellia bacterium]
MDHKYIEEHNITDRYLMGQLSVREQGLFEEHFLDCQQCRSLLEAAHHFRLGLRSAIASGETGAEDYLQSHRTEKVWLTPRNKHRWKLVLQTAAALLVALLIACLLLDRRRARNELARASQATAELQRKYLEAERAWNDLMTDIQARNRQLTEKEDQLNALKANLRIRAMRSQDAVSVFALSMARGGNSLPSGGPTNEITLSPRSELVIFLLELESDTEVKSYRATISTAQKQKIWRMSNLKSGSNNMLILDIEPRLLKPKRNYLLTLEGNDP